MDRIAHDTVEVAAEKDLWNRRSVAVNSLLFALKLAAGIFTMSLAVLSDAMDSGIDVVTSSMARYSVKMADTPADEDHRYGHGKYENLSGLVQSMVVVMIAIFLMVGAVARLISGVVLDMVEWGIVIMLISIAGKYVVSRNLIRVGRKYGSIAMEANALNLRMDIWMSAGVLLSLALIWLVGPEYPNIAYLDPAVALVIAGFIIKTGIGIARRSTADLLDESIPREEQEMVEEILARHSGSYLEYHRLRARKSGSQRHLDMHLVVSRNMSLERAHDLSETIEREIGEALGDASVVIHVEPCSGECEECGRNADE